ncbi:MAG: hypothetical protein K0R78_3511, partial [Pelosinus sp.]|nr:hypothetical protein [Pelosinus sp.]
TVPDYQGCFLRGAGSVTSNHFGAVIHSSGALGELQGDSIRNIYGNIGPIQFTQSHLQHTGGAFYATKDSTYGWGVSDLNSRDYTTGGQGYFPLWLDASKIVPTANENRPINKAVIYLIKAK